VPYILIGRCEEGRLTQFKDNLRTSSVYNVPAKGRGVRSPEALHDLSFGKRICKLRKEDKENL
jgi:hypothetical protein